MEVTTSGLLAQLATSLIGSVGVGAMLMLIVTRRLNKDDKRDKDDEQARTRLTIVEHTLKNFDKLQADVLALDKRLMLMGEVDARHEKNIKHAHDKIRCLQPLVSEGKQEQARLQRELSQVYDKLAEVSKEFSQLHEEISHFKKGA